MGSSGTSGQAGRRCRLGISLEGAATTLIHRLVLTLFTTLSVLKFICFFFYGGSYEGNLHPNLVLQFVCIFQAVLLCECWSVKILIRIRSAVVDSIAPELFFDTKLVLGYTESNRLFKAVYIF